MLKFKNKSFCMMIISSLFLILVIFFLIINPNKYINSAFNGILIWAKAVLPALFPFFFITKLLTELGGIQILAKTFHKITQKIFHINGIGSYVFFTSILSGYPVGAKITSELYEKNLITKNESHRLITFTSTSGPLFIIGTVGVGMFGSAKLGFIVLISHFLGAIVNGLIFRNYKYDKKNKNEKYELKFKVIEDNILEKTMISAINSVLIVGGFITIFFIFIDIFNDIGLIRLLNKILCECFSLFGINSDYVISISTGIFEMTRGCYELSTSYIDFNIATIITTFLVTFGGISTQLQAMTFLQKCGIKTSFFVLQKLSHSLIASFLAFLFCLI